MPDVLRQPGSARRALSLVLGLATALAMAGCRRPAPQKEATKSAPPSELSTEPLELPPAAPTGSAATPAPTGSAAAGSLAPGGKTAGGKASGGKGGKGGPFRFFFDGPEEPIAQGGAATVYSRGVIWRLAGNAAQVSLIKPKGVERGPGAPERARKWPRGRVSVAEDESGSAHAYWVEGQSLMRSTLDADGKLGAPEAVVNDAVPGSSPAAARAAGRDVVAYLGMPHERNADRHARLWLEGGSATDLSPEGSGATSIQIVPVGGPRVIAVWLDARQAMSPVHARRFEVRDGSLAMASDDVIFVGGPAEGFPEIGAVRLGDAAATLFPTSTDKGFALHDILSGWTGPVRIKTLNYPNGLDPAPVAAANACGETLVLYARPEGPKAGAAQVLELGILTANGSIEPQEVVAYPGQVVELSAAATSADTVWAVYTAGQKSFALRIGCGKDLVAPKH